ncbi:MAG: dihydroorotase [Dethiobacteria bacterium]|nr:dihydroorotase [Dethiobacteria bacterium]
MKTLLISGGRVIDPSRNYDQDADLLISEGIIEAVGRGLNAPPETEIIDASGLVVSPGLIDMHVHLRDPGYEYKEDILSGARAAAAGGFTAVAAMANTSPVADDLSVIGYVRERASHAAVRIHPFGALTKGLEGKELAELGRMQAGGAVAFSDDGRPVVSGLLMRNALQYAKGIDALIVVHEEDPYLAAGGMMHEGPVSSVLGLRGIPAAAEEVMLARDLLLLKQSGGRMHVAHLSTAGSVEMVRRAKAEGLAVTAEVTPHHLLLTERAVKNLGYSTNTKVNPPLRSESDRQALWAGLIDGTIDAVASDHAPHHPDDKDVEYDFAPFGIAGLETTLSLLLDELSAGRIKKLTLPLLLEKLSTGPARILRLSGGDLHPGSKADLTLIDLKQGLTVNPDTWYSKASNTPFAGRRLTGAAAYTIVGGQVVMKRGVVAEEQPLLR